jgi:hypothetical protein
MSAYREFLLSVDTVERPYDRNPRSIGICGWWARGELNHSTAASYQGLYAKLQVSAVLLGGRCPFDAVVRRPVMPRGITDDLRTSAVRSGDQSGVAMLRQAMDGRHRRARRA